MSQPNFYRRYNFSIEPGQIFERDVFAAYIAFFSFSDEDGAANVDIRFNGGEFNRVTPSTRFDFTETLVTPTASDASGTFVNKVGLRNNGNKTVTGAFATSMGRITDSILAFGDDTAGSGIPTRVVGTVDSEVAIKKGQLFPVADLASMDDSGILLNSEMEFALNIKRGTANNPTRATPRVFGFSWLSIFNYSGLTVGDLYAVDLERIESPPNYWGHDGNPASGEGNGYAFELNADISIFFYNGFGATQKRGYRRGGIFQHWSGTFNENYYGNILENKNLWHDCSEDLSDSPSTALASATFRESKMETRPFIFRASATSITLQALTSGELLWSRVYEGAAPYPDLSHGGLRIRSSIQPVNPDALAEAEND